MKALHITSHVGTKRNIENVFNYLDIKEKLVTEESIFKGLYINNHISGQIWDYYKNKLNYYNVLIFTDTSMIARPFIQYIDQHNLTLIIYITNRFDWGLWRNFINCDIIDDEYYELYKKISHHERVFFCSDNNYDQYYAKMFNINFIYDTPIKLTPLLSNSIINSINNKFFIYNRGTKINHYKHFLDERNIEYDIFGGDNGERFRDCEHICEYKGFIHLPYQTNIQSLWENLGYYIIYFIPSKKFIYELIFGTDWYYWEEKTRNFHWRYWEDRTKSLEILNNSIELSEWYIKENEELFEYFDNWDDIKSKLELLTEEYLLNKKQKIKNFIEQNNLTNIEKWGKMLKILKQ